MNSAVGIFSDMSVKAVGWILLPSDFKIIFLSLLLTYKQCLFDVCVGGVTLEQRRLKFLCVDVLTACIPGYLVSAWYPWRPEEGV